jgi:hypothetical protein
MVEFHKSFEGTYGWKPGILAKLRWWHRRAYSSMVSAYKVLEAATSGIQTQAVHKRTQNVQSGARLAIRSGPVEATGERRRNSLTKEDFHNKIQHAAVLKWKKKWRGPLKQRSCASQRRITALTQHQNCCRLRCQSLRNK